MQIKKILVLIGVISVVFSSCFLAVSNKSIAIPGSELYSSFESPKSSDTTNLEIIDAIFDSKNSDYSSNGY